MKAFRERAHDRRHDRGVLLDGAHLIRDALAAGVRVRTLLASTDFLQSATPADRRVMDEAAHAGAEVFEATAAVLDAASPVRTSSGVVALAEWIPQPIDATFQPAPALVVGLVGVQDPGNVGAVIRSADALGGTGVAALGATAHPAGWKALRGAMGSTFRVPVAVDGVEAAVEASRRAQLRVIAAAPGSAEPIGRVDLRQSTLILLGSEGAGLPPDVLAMADQHVAIPMRTGVESLNVAVTAALILYEARRQRIGE